MFEKIVFLCTGNICRSPIAEGLAKRALNSLNFQISSLGTGALIGRPADPSAIRVSTAHGIDLTQHIARQASERLLKEADLILALDKTHLKWTISTFPILRGRIHLLGKWSGDQEVPDPYCEPIAAFEASFNQIQKHVEEWTLRLKSKK